MPRIALLSDTHNYWDTRYEYYFATCDEIWHAGDFCTPLIADRLNKIAKLRAVCGNGDGAELRLMFPELLRFKCEEVEVVMKHIGGYPGYYDRSIRTRLKANPPRLFIAGHSHILKVMRDTSLQMLHLNPGAAGIQGWHKQRTLMRFCIDGIDIHDLEIVELGQSTQELYSIL